MARTKTSVSNAVRFSAYMSVSVLARVFPREAVKSALARSGRASKRLRELPADVVVYFVIAMGLFRSLATQEVLRCLLDGLRVFCGTDWSGLPQRAAISHARIRLGTEPFDELRRTHVKPLAGTQTKGSWFRGLRLMAIDGTTLSMPDETANRTAFGAPATGRGVSAFPTARLVALVEVGTRAMLAWQCSPYRTAEVREAEKLLKHLSKGMLVLADRHYFGFPFWKRAKKTGADLLWRVRDNMRFPVLEAYPDGSYRSTLRGSGADRRKSKGRRSVRIVEYTLDGKPGTYRLATTLRPAQASARELAELYHERWEIEIAFDEIKGHLLTPGPGASTVLRSKTPDLVYQEVSGLMLAHYVARTLAHETALVSGEDPDRISFTHTVHVIRRRLQNKGASPP